jgi:hypothetical protein
MGTYAESYQKRDFENFGANLIGRNLKVSLAWYFKRIGAVDF